MLSGGSVFIYHTTSFRKVYNQVSLGASDTIRAKEMYKAQANEIYIETKIYHGDNGIYKSKQFKDDQDRRHQTMT